MTTKYTVILEDQTVGHFNQSGEVLNDDQIDGTVRTVNLRDENGNQIQATGVVEATLEVDTHG